MIKEDYDKIASLGCILCHHLDYGHSEACIHHIRRGGMKRSNAPVIPLCWHHHQGPKGVHGLGRRAFVDEYGITEEELRDMMLTMLNKG